MCHRGPKTGHTLYRAGAKGGDPDWRCNLHLNEEASARKADPNLGGVVKIIEDANGSAWGEPASNDDGSSSSSD